MRRTPAIAILLLLVALLSAGCATVSLVESIESLIQQAKELLDARRFDEALAKLTEVIRRDPTQWKAYLYSAQAYIGKLDWTAALTNVRKARELAPSDGAVLATLGESLFGAGREALQRGTFAVAVGHFVEYVKLRPTDAAGYLNAGRAYLVTRNWADALQFLTNGLGRASDPTARQEFARTLLDGGRQALSLGDASGAIGLLREYVRQEPADAAGYLNAGRAYLGTRNWGDAVHVLADGLGRASDPAARQEFARTLLDGGRQALSLGEARGAIGLLREYVRHEPADVAALVNLGKAYVNAGEHIEALGAFRRVLELAPQNEEARRFLLGR
jgi:tetratricopeptide (TPR) repeat protein